MQTQRLRIAIQKKGRLSQECQELLKKCGVKFNIMGERLVVHSLNMPIDLLLVRDDDIPGLIMDGVVDLGFVGENVLEETRLDRLALNQRNEFTTLRRMDFGGCRLSIAIEKDAEYRGPQDLNGKRIATTYPQLLKAYMDCQGVDFSTCMLTGSVEVAPRAGLADAIADLVSTGATLEANGLKEVEVIFESKATLIQRPGAFAADKAALMINSSLACTACNKPKNRNTSCCTLRLRSWRKSKPCCPERKTQQCFPCLPTNPKSRYTW